MKQENAEKSIDIVYAFMFIFYDVFSSDSK